MNLTAIGDLARGMTLRSRATEIKTQIENLSYEMSSGKVQNMSHRLGGDYSHLLDLENKLTRLDAYKVATAEAGLFADAMQKSLTMFSNSVGEMSNALLAFGSASHTVTHEQASVQARNELDTMISALNTRIGGRSLFSGTATDTSPLPSAETLLAALRTEVAGQVTASDIMLAAENWFNDPLGFGAVIFQGSATPLAPMQISENERISLPVTATDPSLKTALKDIALAALATDISLALAPDQRTALFTQLGVNLANTRDDAVTLRAQVGAAEARVDQATSRNAAARTSLEYSRNQLIAADPYETAARLQTVQFQLESLYSVTVRNANLSLVNFLR